MPVDRPQAQRYSASVFLPVSPFSNPLRRGFFWRAPSPTCGLGHPRFDFNFAAQIFDGFPGDQHALAAEHGAGLGDVVPWDIEAYKLTAMDMLLESGAELLLYTMVSEPVVKDKQIEGVIVDNKSSRQAILAKVVIDTTGDGDGE